MKNLQRWLTYACLGAAMLCIAGNAPAKERAGKPSTRPGAGLRAGPGANRDQRPGGQAGQRLGKMQQVLAELNLTPEQKEQIAQIQQETRQKMQALRGQLKDLSPQDRRARVQEAVGNVHEKIEAVLTDEQKAQLKEKMGALRQGQGPGQGQGPRGKDGFPGAGRRRPNAAPDAPDQPNATPPQRGRGAMIERLRDNLSQLDLTDAQKQQVETILSEASDRLVKLREASQDDLEALREKASGVFQEVRQKLHSVLTPEQQQKMRELMPRGGPGRPQGDASPPDPKPKAKPDAPPGAGQAKTESTMMSSDPAPAKAEAASSSASDTASSLASLTTASRFAPGTPAPDFHLKNLDGRATSLQNFRGKPTVLLFGSFTSPTFRDRVEAFEALKKEYRGKANVVVIYTREAHPNNEWDVQRNIDEQIRVSQHATIEERLKIAKLTRDGMKISMDMLVDEMDDGVAATYDASPNGCAVIDGSGKIVLKQKWADAFGARAALDEALQTR